MKIHFSLDKNLVFFSVVFKDIFLNESQVCKEKNDVCIDVKVSITFKKCILIMRKNLFKKIPKDIFQTK
ncbi:hypothetical protein BAQ48_02550 [Bacillus luti]|nr:hypothetical protein BAQ48_02550 [Bacillus luti]